MEVKPLPSWAMKRYSVLWSNLKSKEFGYEDAANVLNEKDKNLLSAFLSRLRKNGWLSIQLDPTDARKRIYKLISPNLAVKEISKDIKK